MTLTEVVKRCSTVVKIALWANLVQPKRAPANGNGTNSLVSNRAPVRAMDSYLRQRYQAERDKNGACLSKRLCFDTAAKSEVREAPQAPDGPR